MHGFQHQAGTICLFCTAAHMTVEGWLEKHEVLMIKSMRLILPTDLLEGMVYH